MCGIRIRITCQIAASSHADDMTPQLAVIYDGLLRPVGFLCPPVVLAAFHICMMCRKKMEEMSGKLGKSFKSDGYMSDVNDSVLRQAKIEYKTIFGHKADACACA